MYSSSRALNHQHHDIDIDIDIDYYCPFYPQLSPSSLRLDDGFFTPPNIIGQASLVRSVLLPSCSLRVVLPSFPASSTRALLDALWRSSIPVFRVVSSHALYVYLIAALCCIPSARFSQRSYKGTQRDASPIAFQHTRSPKSLVLYSSYPCSCVTNWPCVYGKKRSIG